MKTITESMPSFRAYSRSQAGNAWGPDVWLREGHIGDEGGCLTAGTWDPTEKIHTMLDDIMSYGSSAFAWVPARLSEPESGLTFRVDFWL